jgi:hypothetical protein
LCLKCTSLVQTLDGLCTRPLIKPTRATPLVQADKKDRTT